MSENVIQIKNLTKQFKTKFGTLTAVDDVSFDIRRGENFGLVGESGSGKSTIGSMIVGTYGPTSGSITFRDEIDISRSSQSREPSLKQQIQLVFQDPGGSLNPRKTIRQILSVPVQLYAGKRLTTAEEEARIKGILEQVGLPVHYLDKYPPGHRRRRKAAGVRGPRPGGQPPVHRAGRAHLRPGRIHSGQDHQ